MEELRLSSYWWCVQSERTAKAQYKLAIRQNNTDEIVDVSNDLHEYLLQKDQPAFWKSRSSKSCNKVKPSEFVDGENDMALIAGSCTVTSTGLFENSSKVISY